MDPPSVRREVFRRLVASAPHRLQEWFASEVPLEGEERASLLAHSYGRNDCLPAAHGAPALLHAAGNLDVVAVRALLALGADPSDEGCFPGVIEYTVCAVINRFMACLLPPKKERKKKMNVLRRALGIGRAFDPFTNAGSKYHLRGLESDDLQRAEEIVYLVSCYEFGNTYVNALPSPKLWLGFVERFMRELEEIHESAEEAAKQRSIVMCHLVNFPAFLFADSDEDGASWQKMVPAANLAAILPVFLNFFDQTLEAREEHRQLPTLTRVCDELCLKARILYQRARLQPLKQLLSLPPMTMVPFDAPLCTSILPRATPPKRSCFSFEQLQAWVSGLRDLMVRIERVADAQVLSALVQLEGCRRTLGLEMNAQLQLADALGNSHSFQDAWRLGAKD